MLVAYEKAYSDVIRDLLVHMLCSFYFLIADEFLNCSDYSQILVLQISFVTSALSSGLRSSLASFPIHQPLSVALYVRLV